MPRARDAGLPPTPCKRCAISTQHVAALGIRVTIIEPGGFRSDFAGPSLVSKPGVIHDYTEINRKIEQYTALRHGNQQNDPAKFGPAMCALVDADNPPLRLPLGDDALAAIRAKLETLQGDLERWNELSRSTRVAD